SSGILVSRSASESNLGNDMLRELAGETKVLYLTGGVLLFLTIFTPLPTIFGIIIGGGLMLVAYFTSQKEKEVAVAQAPGGAGGGFAGLEGPKPKGPSGGAEGESAQMPSAPSLTSAEEVSEILQSDTLDVEFGYGILPLADPGQGGDLLDRITMVRKQTAYEYGLILSPIRVRDSVLLKANEYMIKLKGTELTKYELWPDRLLAINPGTAQGVLPGIASREPAFGLSAYWIDESQRDQAANQGYTVVDPPSVFATHFSEIVKQHAHELLGRKEMDLLIKGLKENFAELADEVIPDVLKVYEVQKILQNLLRERVSIRNLPLIFETISEYAEKTKDIDYLTEFTRRALKRQICIANRSDDGQIHAVGIDPNLERQLSSQIRETEDERYLALNPDMMQQLVDRFSKGVEKIMQKGYMPIIVCSGNIRLYLYKALEKSMQSIPFISYEELVDDIPFSVETVIKI
ncbi:MAG TPA: flagellar biosynthesis protein FlhA, partial [Thermotogota bacterium]|nr:flagellar biosynthesis protein FlhA [Thermotogota bacterium]